MSLIFQRSLRHFLSFHLKGASRDCTRKSYRRVILETRTIYPPEVVAKRYSSTLEHVPDHPAPSTFLRVILATIVATGGITLGSLLSQYSAAFLEENDIFVPSEED